MIKEMKMKAMRTIVKGLVKGIISGAGYKLFAKMFGFTFNISEKVAESSIEIDKYELKNYNLSIEIDVKKSVMEKLQKSIKSEMMKGILDFNANTAEIIKEMCTESDFTFILDEFQMEKYSFKFGGIEFNMSQLNVNKFEINIEEGHFILNANIGELKVLDPNGNVKQYLENLFIKSIK